MIMYKFIIEVNVFGHYCNVFNNYIIADNEEKALQIADELLSKFYAGRVRLSDFTYRVKIIGDTSFKAVYKTKRKNARKHIACKGTYEYCSEYVRYFDKNNYYITIEDFNGNVIKHCK